MELVVLAVAQPITAGLVVWLLTRYLAARDERESEERRVLLNRVQAPKAAQKQAEMELQAPNLDDPPFVGWDNDEEFHEARTKVIDGS